MNARFQGAIGGGIDMCMFNNMDIDCSKECPEKIRKICDSGFSEEIENIISLAVSKGRKKTLEEINAILGEWNPYKQIQPIPYSGDTDEHVDLRRSGSETIKDDVMDEIKYRIQDEEKRIERLKIRFLCKRRIYK